jgi:hypothetical protein
MFVEKQTIIEPKVVMAIVNSKVDLLPQLSDTDENSRRPQKEPKYTELLAMSTKT